MKNLLIILAGLSMSQMSFGQVKIGAKLSYGVMTISSSETQEFLNYESASLYELQYIKSNNCVSLGVSAIAESKNGFLMMDLMYRNCTDVYQLRTKSSDHDNTKEYQESFQKIHIPLVGGLKLGQFKIGAGPILNIGISSHNELNTMEGFSMSKNRYLLGYQFLIGYKASEDLHFNLKREVRFQGFTENYKVNDQTIGIVKIPKMITLELAMYF